MRLLVASWDGDEESVRYMLESGVRVNAIIPVSIEGYDPHHRDNYQSMYLNIDYCIMQCFLPTWL